VPLKPVSARTGSLFTYLEPVYRIALAALLVHEVLNIRTIIGCAIVLMSVFIVSRS
jgi:drug/metabolite transporter (DMT)-like permease